MLITSLVLTLISDFKNLMSTSNSKKIIRSGINYSNSYLSEEPIRFLVTKIKHEFAKVFANEKRGRLVIDFFSFILPNQKFIE